MDSEPPTTDLAAAVVEEFLQLAVEGNAAAAGQLMTRGSANVRAFDPRGLAGARYRAHEPMDQEGMVVVPVELADASGQQAMIPLVVVMEDGAARVDVAASVELMMGASLHVASGDEDDAVPHGAVAAFREGPLAAFGRQVRENVAAGIAVDMVVDSFMRHPTREENLGALRYLATELLRDLGMALREVDDRVGLAGRISAIRVEASSAGPSVSAEESVITYRLATLSPAGCLTAAQLAASIERLVAQTSR